MVRGPLEEPVTLALCGRKSGVAHLLACDLKCVITASLPAAAERKMPPTAVATMYIRTLDPGGIKNNDTDTICFIVKDLGLTPPTIYRYIAGV